MPRDLSRLLRPQSIAVVGGGAWCMQVVRQSLAMGFAGEVFRVHPVPDPVEGITAVPRLSDLPVSPDAVFLGINRHATVQAVAELAEMRAGGAVCFASGFAEAFGEDAASTALQADLVAAAGDMPILGPNCYGFVNALDGALLWPDQHGCKRVTRGIAILTQSSNIAINLTMQKRAVPIAFAVTCGNMAQTTQAEIAMGLLDDPRVTAIGLHVEGFGDTAAWHGFACKAHAMNVPVVVLKVGASEQARQAAVSHTASLAGSDAGTAALLARFGMARVHDLTTLLETLMLLHCNGALASSEVASISCSGGEASLVADVAALCGVTFPPLTDAQKTCLFKALGPMVALSNPLDYHTYVWGDVERMTAAWLPMAADNISLLLIILDYPHTDATAWESATAAAISVRQKSGRPVAVVSTLPELLPEEIAEQFIANGVTPLHGLREALAAVKAAACIRKPLNTPPLAVAPSGTTASVCTTADTVALARCGLRMPRSVQVARDSLQDTPPELREPLALKALGLAHKSEAGGVKLNLARRSLTDAAHDMPGDMFLVQEMVPGAVCELLIGVLHDAAHGYVLTLAAGGVLTELWQDRVSFLLPVTHGDVRDALHRLRVFALLTGYRGAPAACLPSVLDAVMAVQEFVVRNAGEVYEVEINPLICTINDAIAADTLITRISTPDNEGAFDGPD